MKKGIGGKLGKKVGPLPLWAWLGVGAGLLLVGYLYMRGRGEGGGDYGYGGVETVTGAEGGSYAPQDAAGAGAPSTATPPESQLSPEIAAALSDLGSNVREVRDELGAFGDQFAPAYDAGVVADSYGGVQESPASVGKTGTKTGRERVYGVNAGRGVYRDRKGKLTYKGAAKPKRRSPAKPKPAGKNIGRGVYRDKGGRLTYKGPAKATAAAKRKPVAKPKARPKPAPRRAPARRR